MSVKSRFSDRRLASFVVRGTNGAALPPKGFSEPRRGHLLHALQGSNSIMKI
jgi:hypothetical protein